ncbi:zinc-ribbon domain-containing protein [Thermoproteota archaeon]
MSICRSCEKELTEDANFCPKCGLRTEKGEKENVRTPEDRRPEWEKDLDLAIKNANKLLEDAVETAKKGLKQVSEEVRTELDRAKEIRTKKKSLLYCPKCVSKNPSDSDYCIKCGAKIHR